MTEEVSNAVNALVNCNKATSILFTLCLSYELEALFGLQGGANLAAANLAAKREKKLI